MREKMGIGSMVSEAALASRVRRRMHKGSYLLSKTKEPTREGPPKLGKSARERQQRYGVPLFVLTGAKQCRQEGGRTTPCYRGRCASPERDTYEQDASVHLSELARMKMISTKRAQYDKKKKKNATGEARARLQFAPQLEIAESELIHLVPRHVREPRQQWLMSPVDCMR